MWNIGWSFDSEPDPLCTRLTDELQQSEPVLELNFFGELAVISISTAVSDPSQFTR